MRSNRRSGRRVRRTGRGRGDEGPALAPAEAGRLEALGLMAGSVAHDVNNLLAVVTAEVESARGLAPPDAAVAARLSRAVEAAAHAAAVNRFVLSFTTRPGGQAEPIDVNALLRAIESLLASALGQAVRLELRLGAGIGTVRADPTRIEQALLNLAFNSRDAMPGGGRFTVETHNLEPTADATGPRLRDGRYVLLSISDDGVGMDPSTLRRAFERGFTTKPPGKGSGLGLASVRQIVDEARGAIQVDSEAGVGTTFRIYLPCTQDAPRAARTRPAEGGLPRGTERILLVEDSEPVRRATASLLAKLGYRVLSAADGIDALALARDDRGPIHLLLADLTMPRLGGRALAERLAESHPETRVVFMSGYGAEPADPEDAQEPPVLPKPFAVDLLARAVRRSLDAPAETVEPAGRPGEDEAGVSAHGAGDATGQTDQEKTAMSHSLANYASRFRAHPRYEVSIPVDCTTRDAFTSNHACNISRGGLFLRSEVPLPLDAEVSLLLHVPGMDRRIRATGRVVWNSDVQQATGQLVRGSGIRFLSLQPEDRSVLEQYLGGLAPEQPDRSRVNPARPSVMGPGRSP